MYVCMSCRALITFDMCRSVKTCVTETEVSQAKGPRLAEEGKGAAQPHQVEGKARQSFPRTRQRWAYSRGAAEDSCSSMYECDIVDS
jgi:hypothetical protein